MKKKVKKIIGILLGLALVLSLMPCMSLTVYADTTKAYAYYDVTTDANKTKSGADLTALQVTFNGKPWYIIEDNSTALNAGTVTLLAADDSFGTSKFDDSSNAYSTSTIKGTLEEMTASGGSFASVKDAIVDTNLSDVGVDGAKLYLLSVDEAEKVPQNVRQFTAGWWLRSPGQVAGRARYVIHSGIIESETGHSVDYTAGLVRPALKLDLSAVTFSSNTFTVKPYVSLKNTTTVVKFDNKDWYLIDFDATTVTLLSKECVGASTFGTNNTYSGSTVEGAVNNYYTNSISAAAKTAVSDNKMFLLTTGEANAITNDEVRKCSPASGVDINRWWLCSPGLLGDLAACVDGDNGNVDDGSIVSRMFGVRPALKLDLSAVHFSSASKEFTLNPYASLVNTTTPVKFNGIDWYIIADNSTAVNAGTVTLLAKDPLIASIFHDSSSNAYSTSTVKDYLEGLTTGSGSFSGVEGAIETINVKGSDADIGVNAKLWLLSTTEANEIMNANSAVLKCSKASGIKNNVWWLRSPGNKNSDALRAAFVYGDDYGNVSADGIKVDTRAGVRPALQLNLPSVNFISVNSVCL